MPLTSTIANRFGDSPSSLRNMTLPANSNCPVVRSYNRSLCGHTTPSNLNRTGEPGNISGANIFIFLSSSAIITRTISVPVRDYWTLKIQKFCKSFVSRLLCLVDFGGKFCGCLLWPCRSGNIFPALPHCLSRLIAFSEIGGVIRRSFRFICPGQKIARVGKIFAQNTLRAEMDRFYAKNSRKNGIFLHNYRAKKYHYCAKTRANSRKFVHRRAANGQNRAPADAK